MKTQNSIPFQIVKRGFVFLLTTALFYACGPKERNIDIAPETLHNTVQKLTNVIVHDIFSPPVASRVYAYPSIAAYEVMARTSEEYVSFDGQLTDFDGIPDPKGEIDDEVAAIQAFIIVGRTLIFSEDKINIYETGFHQLVKDKGLDDQVFNNSLAYAQEVAEVILAWSGEDKYKETRTFQKFTVMEEEARWQPTPPGYFDAIEPHWSQIRPFVIDSSDQFTPMRPTDFDMNKDSDFYKEVMEVYEVSNDLDEEQTEIASFWDCNPFVMNVQGHAMFATKKITPGGHWMGIAKIACETDSADFLKSTATYALTAIALADGFISCWDEKYRSNLIRPETVINEFIDPNWVPLLQTPPFPEYTSGHSVISGAAGVALTSLYGDDFAFVDDTELAYGLTLRTFESFTAASNEAAISRLYGGIHYMPAITNGVTQGRKLGAYIVENIQLQK